MRGGSGTDTLERVSTAEAYVAALDGALVGPRRVRRGLVREARDHLEDASEAFRRGGLERSEAERLAVADFGDLDVVVPAFQTTLAVAASRRTALMLFAVLSVQPFLWDGPLGPDNGPRPDGLAFAVLDRLVELGGGVMIAAALALLVLTGIGNRWFAAGRGLARLTAITALVATVSIKLIGLGMVLLSSGTQVESWVLFGVFIVVPFAVTGSQARRTLALC